MASNQLAPPRVVTTTHKSDGTTVIGSDAQATPFFPFGPGGSSFSIFHSSDTVPVSNTGPLPSTVTSTVPRAPPNGVMFCTSDISPGQTSPMHRTVSLDYACVLSGEITLKLDGGEETIVKTGEFILQRGGMHLWFNHTQEPCRILCVLLGSEKIVTEEGKELDAFFPSRPDA
ncbi:hypothetical protein ACLMJK_000975 [Lecanora helva]